jgi:hypothetical protein
MLLRGLAWLALVAVGALLRTWLVNPERGG